MKKVLISTLIVVLVAIIAYFSYVIIKRGIYTTNSQDISTQDETKTNDTQTGEKPSTLLTYPDSVVTDESFFEKQPIISGQQAYVAYPKTIDTTNPPTIIIFSHGSNTNIINNMNDAFMKEMRAYGKYFTKENYVFCASSMHFVNEKDYSWSFSTNSLNDMKNLIDWIEKNYKTQTKVDLLAHSLGGRPTFNFAFKYPTIINKIALLAPVSDDYTKAQFKLIKNVPIQIWHGDQDRNVLLSSSISLRNMYNSDGFTNLVLTILKGKAHFDVVYALKPEILEFLNK